MVEFDSFHGYENEKALDHFNKVGTIIDLFVKKCMSTKYLMTKFFPFWLKYNGKEWYDSLKPESFTTPQDFMCDWIDNSNAKAYRYSLSPHLSNQ